MLSRSAELLFLPLFICYIPVLASPTKYWMCIHIHTWTDQAWLPAKYCVGPPFPAKTANNNCDARRILTPFYQNEAVVKKNKKIALWVLCSDQCIQLRTLFAWYDWKCKNFVGASFVWINIMWYHWNEWVIAFFFFILCSCSYVKNIVAELQYVAFPLCTSLFHWLK